jgi:hypothetical protein
MNGVERRADVLDNLLEQSGCGATADVAAIAGPAGVGKSTLAVHWAHPAAARFPVGQLYVNLRGFDPDRLSVPSDAVGRFVDALDVPQHRILAGLAAARTALHCSVLADRRMIVMLDKARDAGQARPLLPASSTMSVRVTAVATTPD